jgi:hypothetical protein
MSVMQLSDKKPQCMRYIGVSQSLNEGQEVNEEGSKGDDNRSALSTTQMHGPAR